jgi:hypothetical protein
MRKAYSIIAMLVIGFYSCSKDDNSPDIKSNIQFFKGTWVKDNGTTLDTIKIVDIKDDTITLGKSNFFDYGFKYRIQIDSIKNNYLFFRKSIKGSTSYITDFISLSDSTWYSLMYETPFKKLKK